MTIHKKDRLRIMNLCPQGHIIDIQGQTLDIDLLGIFDNRTFKMLGDLY